MLDILNTTRCNMSPILFDFLRSVSTECLELSSWPLDWNWNGRLREDSEVRRQCLTTAPGAGSMSVLSPSPPRLVGLFVGDRTIGGSEGRPVLTFQYDLHVQFANLSEIIGTSSF